MTTQFRDVAAARRFEQGFTDADGCRRRVRTCDSRGAGAAGRFMQALVDHARAERLKLVPRCSYAVAWLKRHREYEDVLA